MSLLAPLLTIVLASIVVMYACSSFDEATSYLGRYMPPGIKGATLNAVGSSLPELLTTTFLLFIYHDRDGFSAGIATCAGSAVFNAVVIPALCILAVTWWGTSTKGSSLKIIPHIELDRKTLLRDGFFFIAAELVLIYFLKDSVMVWWMGGALMIVYVVYFCYLMWQWMLASAASKFDEEEYEPVGPPDLLITFSLAPKWSNLKSVLTFDFNQVFFYGMAYNAKRAWFVLSCSVGTIAMACLFLSKAVIDSADALGVPAYFTAVILGAAATSVPDTVISMKDAVKGNYDDAISNAVGSNIFDITICLGLPLFIYGIIYGDVALSGLGPARVQELRIALVCVTVVVLGLFLSTKKIGQWRGWILLSLYGLWTAFILGRAMHTPWLKDLLG